MALVLRLLAMYLEKAENERLQEQNYENPDGISCGDTAEQSAREQQSMAELVPDHYTVQRTNNCQVPPTQGRRAEDAGLGVSTCACHED